MMRTRWLLVSMLLLAHADDISAGGIFGRERQEEIDVDEFVKIFNDSDDDTPDVDVRCTQEESPDQTSEQTTKNQEKDDDEA